MTMSVGLLHPGQMGSFLGRAIADRGHRVLWVGAGRSPATHVRAARFTEVGDLAELVGSAEVIVSICPPAYAVELASAVAEAGFSGRYVDANAASPQTVARVARALPTAQVIDGAIIGGPSTEDAVLHLSGEHAAEAAALFAPESLTVQVMEGPFGSASALKACYALTSKAMTALLLTARSAAVAAGVEAELVAEWDRTQPGVSTRTEKAATGVGAKAWRFGAEMTEAAEFFRGVEAAGGFSTAAAEVFDRLADLRRLDPSVDPQEVWRRLAAGEAATP